MAILIADIVVVTFACSWIFFPLFALHVLLANDDMAFLLSFAQMHTFLTQIRLLSILVDYHHAYTVQMTVFEQLIAKIQKSSVEVEQMASRDPIPGWVRLPEWVWILLLGTFISTSTYCA